MNLGLFTPYPEQRVRLENISSVQGNIILCEKLKTNLCGKLRNNNRCKIGLILGVKTCQTHG